VWGHLPGAPSSSLAYTLHRKAEGETRDGVAARLKGASEAELFADVAALAPAVSLVDAATLPPPRTYSPPAPTSTDLSSKPITRELTTTFRTSSFSALTATHDGSARAALGRDRDLVSPPEASPDAVAPGLDEDDPLRDFPAGPRTGDLLHRVLEVVDFPSADEASVAKLAREALAEAGYDVERWTLPVTRGLLAAIDTPLDREGALSLRGISRKARRSELEFSLPVRPARDGALTAAALADVFAAHASAPVPASYATRLRGLHFPALEGFLRGFVDLVFSHGGRFYVVDYKSNRLGKEASDYRAPRLAVPMAQHHYILQYHLYVLALDRWLSRRVPAYRYETHFGGAYYLFLRGMSPARGASHGVYFDKPSLELVRALGALIGEVSS
jgi:exodeoxyribonuclease V beta subunit